MDAKSVLKDINSIKVDDANMLTSIVGILVKKAVAQIAIDYIF